MPVEELVEVDVEEVDKEVDEEMNKEVDKKVDKEVDKEVDEEVDKEVDEEVDMGEAFPTGDLAPEQALALQVALLAAAGFWAGGPGDLVAG